MAAESSRARRKLGLATALLLLGLCTMTHWPGFEIGTPSDPGPDKTAHMIAFGLASAGAWFSGWFRSLVLLWIAAAIWAALDEWTQGLPPFRRVSDAEDWLADVLGATLAIGWIAATRPLGGWEARGRRAARDVAVARLFARVWPWIVVALGAVVGAAAAMPIFSYIGARSWAMPSNQVMITGMIVVSIASALATTECLLRLTTYVPRPLLPDRVMLRLCAGPALAALAILVLLTALSQLVMMLRPVFGPAALLDDWYRTRSQTLRSAIDLAIIIGLAAWACRRARRNVAARVDRAHLECVRCDQSLTGLTVSGGRGVCPECGTAYEIPPAGAAPVLSSAGSTTVPPPSG